MILIFLLVIAVGGLGAIVYGITLYNGLIDLNAHERQTLQQVIEARNAVASANGAEETANADSQLSGALRKLFALAESYPDLKADSTFLHLQSRISSLEEQIADRREFYNHAVNQYNIRIAQIPDVFIARQLGYQDKQYFRATEEDRKDVEIQFSHLQS
jgi:LemA protein